jgi:hypothetical protein
MTITVNMLLGLGIIYANQGPSNQDIFDWTSPNGKFSNLTFNDAVKAFATSDIAKTNYSYLATPGVADAGQYVLQIYSRQFGLTAEQIAADEDLSAGLAYWTNWLTDNPLGDDDGNGIPNYQQLPLLMYEFAPASLQKAQDNRQAVALDYANQLGVAGSSTFTASQVAQSWAIINTVTSDDATVAAAKASTTQFIANGGGQSGTTFALTPATDIFNGGAGNDRFIGSEGFVQASDQLNGGGGTNNTFQYFLAGVGAGDTGLPQLTNVQAVELIGIEANIPFSFNTAQGLKTVTYVAPAPAVADINIAGLPDNVALGLQNASTVNTIVASWTNSTAATLNLTNVPGLDAATLNNTKLNTLTVNVQGGSQSTVSIKNLTTDSTVVKTVSISSDKSLTIDTLLTNASLAASATFNTSGVGSTKVTNKLADKFTTIDAIKLDGGINIQAGDGDVTFTGGKGNDTISFTKTKFTNKDILDGGAGADKLVLNDSNLDATLTTAVNAAKNFETLGLVLDGADATLDATKITAFKGYEFSGVASKIDIAGATPDNTFALVGLNNTGKDFTVVANDQKAATNTKLTVQDKSTIDSLTFTAFSNSTLNVVSQIATGKSTDGNTINIKAGGTPSGIKFVVTGDQDLTLNAVGATATQIGVSIDASSLSGKLTATGATGNNSTAGNTIVGAKAADSLTGGNGSDFITGNDGADILTGSGNGLQGDLDTFIYLNVANSNAGSLTAGKESYDTITDFQNSFVVKDVLNLKAAGWSASQLQPQAIIDPTVTTLDSAVLAASDQIGANNLGFFLFQANTYVLGNDTDKTKVGASDLLVQLNGPQNLTASNFTA